MNGTLSCRVSKVYNYHSLTLQSWNIVQPTAQLMYIKVPQPLIIWESVNDYVYIQMKRLLDQMEFVKVCLLCVVAPPAVITKQLTEHSWLNLIKYWGSATSCRSVLERYVNGVKVGWSGSQTFWKELNIRPIKNKVWEGGSKSCAHHEVVFWLQRGHSIVFLVVMLLL